MSAIAVEARTARYPAQVIKTAAAGGADGPRANGATGQQAEWPELVPFGNDDLPSFPAWCLPGWARDYVQAVATATQTPLDLAAMVVLSVLATACAKRFKAQVTPGYSEPLNLFTATILPPAARKSSVFRAMVGPLEEFEEEEVRRLAPVIAEAQERLDLDRARLKKLRAKAATKAHTDEERAARQEAETEILELAARIAESQVPPRPRLIADEATPEKLTRLLYEQGGRMAVLSAEGDVFDLMAGRYNDKGTGNFGVYLKGHSGDTIRVDRIGRESEYVQEPALTVGVTVQPEVIRSLGARRSFRGRGLLGRFLYSFPPSLLGRREVDPPPVEPETSDAYRRKLKALAGFTPGRDANGNPVAQMLTLSDEARGEWQGFAAWLEPQLAEDGKLSGLTDWAGKLAGAVARIAGLLHLAEHAGEVACPRTVEAATMRAAVEIGKYLIPHARKAFDLTAADPAVAAAQHILRWLARHELQAFPKRDAFQALKGHFKQVADLERGLSVLVERGYLRKLPVPEHAGPGRPPGPRYEVSPRLGTGYRP